MTEQANSRLSQYANKRAKYMAHRGTPLRVPAGPIRDHVLSLNAEGMSGSQIAEAAKCAPSTVKDLARGMRSRGRPVKFVEASVSRRILAVRYEPDVGSRRSAQMDPVGTRRRLQALQVAGFPLYTIEEAIGISFVQLNELALGHRRGRKYVSYRVKTMVANGYKKLCNVRPEDMGLSIRAMNMARTAGRKHGYAPPSCWDEDTIDDPNAVPEWTGACGTSEGAEIHRREGIPICQACTKTTVYLCGTEEGYRSHIRNKIEIDDACREAHRVTRAEERRKAKEDNR